MAEKHYITFLKNVDELGDFPSQVLDMVIYWDRNYRIVDWSWEEDEYYYTNGQDLDTHVPTAEDLSVIREYLYDIGL